MRASGRCSVSQDDGYQSWLKERGIEDIEAFVPDMAGSARGKVLAGGQVRIRFN